MSNDRIDYNDDGFLESLMEDVMGTNTDKASEEDSYNEEQDTQRAGLVETEIDEKEIDVDEKDASGEVARPSRPRRAGGLLGHLSSLKSDSDDESGEVVEEQADELTEEDPSESEKLVKESDFVEANEDLGDVDPAESDTYGSNVGVESDRYGSNVGVESAEKASSRSLLEAQDFDFKFNRRVSETDAPSISEENEEQSGSQDEDLLDIMLDGLEEEEDIEGARERSQLDEEVEVPLEKPGMDEVIVTSDGRTLAEMLPGMRRGRKPTDKVVDEIRNQESVVVANGEKFSDDRYVKHVEVISEEQARDEERVALSMKYLQKNAEFTEQEKIIMRNLGLTSEQLSSVMKSQELSRKQKKEILALGRYGSEKVFKGRRYRTTVGDSAMLEFLTKFKFANTRILRWISNEPQGRTWRKLSRLRNSGLVESRSLIGVPDLWGATPSGVAISGYAYEPGLRPMPKMFSISSNMGVNYVAACLWFNSVNVLNLEDFPSTNRVIALQDDGRDRVRGEMLVSEYEIRSSLGKEISPQSTTMQTLGDERLYDVISANVRSEVERWENGGKIGESPEFMLGNEYMWVLYPTSQLTLSYHVPDLIVKRERGPNGEPKSIAVEMERYEKSNDRYDKIMLAYKLDEHLYEEVVWITPNTRVARALEKAATAVGFDRYRIVPIITETGIYTKQDIWMI